jgi:peptidoglycan/xylan/chitin deacetylase (PgdA/CDA1 family)
MLLAAGSIYIRFNFYLRSYCQGDTNKRQVALSFDDGPDERITPMVLDVLKEHGVAAVFFVIGSRASAHPELIERMHREGHVIGNHSDTHGFFFDLLSFRKMVEDVQHTNTIVHGIIRKKMKLFRPPYGVTNPVVARTLKQLKLYSIGWSLKSGDTVCSDRDIVLNRLIHRVRPGDLVLFHDNRQVVPALLGAFIEYLKQQAYHIERPDKMLNLEPYEKDR